MLITSPYRPEPHPDAAAFGFTRCTFFDDFNDTSTIDMANTGNPGFNWYLSNAWPNAVTDAAGWAGIKTNSATPTSEISVSNSILKITRPATANPYGYCLNSACANGSGFTGNVFGGGFYLQAKVAADQTISYAGSGGWPGLWSADIDFFTGSSTSMIELDHFEMYTSDAVDLAIHEWGFSGSTITNDSTQAGGGGNPSWWPLPDYRDFHTIGWLWVPMSKNGGTGIIRRYVDGQLATQWNTSYTASGQPSPAMSPNSSNGSLSELDAQRQMLMLWCGTNWPFYVDYVSIWQ